MSSATCFTNPSLRASDEYTLRSKRLKTTGFSPFNDVISMPKFKPVDRLKLQFPNLSEEVSLAYQILITTFHPEFT